MGPSDAQGKEREKEMLFSAEGCKLINIEGQTKRENHAFVTIM